MMPLLLHDDIIIIVTTTTRGIFYLFSCNQGEEWLLLNKETTLKNLGMN